MRRLQMLTRHNRTPNRNNARMVLDKNQFAQAHHAHNAGAANTEPDRSKPKMVKMNECT